MDIADFPVFGVFRLPAVSRAVETSGKIRETVCAFKDAGVAQGFGVAQIGAGVVGEVDGGGKGGCPTAVTLMPDAAQLGRADIALLMKSVSQNIFFNCFRAVRIIGIISRIGGFFAKDRAVTAV